MLITQEDLARIVTETGTDQLMDEAIEALEKALLDRDVVEVRRRDGFVIDNEQASVVEWMPVVRHGDVVALKIVAYNPANPRLAGLPTILATNTLYDCRTGALSAVMDGTFTTALRTGAASAVASRQLAVQDSAVLGLVGCGAQAVTQVHALSRVLPLRRVLVHDTDPQAMWSFPGRVEFCGLPVEAAGLAELERCSDVICTVTSVAPGAGPVLSGTGLAPHVHINAVGSDLPGKTELPVALLREAVVCPDYPPQAVTEGECQQLPTELVGPTLAEVVTGGLGPTLRHRRTVFDSTGVALQDLVVAEIVLRHARRIGVGSPLPLFTGTTDAMDPYWLARSAAPAPA